MEDMIAAEPSLVAPILSNTTEAAGIAELIHKAVADRATVVAAGCGTSETAAMAVADLLTEALKRIGVETPVVHVRQALEASLDPWQGGLCVGISHDGSTRATTLAMDAARRSGASTALITARPQGAASAVADVIMTTPMIDRSWCHTVGYLSPVLAGKAIADAVDASQLDAGGLRTALDDVLSDESQIESVARSLFAVDRLVVTAAGADRSPAKELALKVEEGVHLPARMLEVETVLHGHLAAADHQTGLLLIATEPNDRLMHRTTMLLEAASAIGLRLGAILSPAVDRQLKADLGLHRALLPASLEPFGLIGRLAGSALALQRLTVALTKAAGTNPDRIRREELAYRDAARRAEPETPW
jgi:glucosamine 6-phosphate synthetase-like amidotransferase/phosphosugar isomerase protein